MVFSPVDLVHGTFFDSAVRIFGLNPLSLPVFRFLWFVRCLLVFTIISPVLLVLTRGRSFILLLGGAFLLICKLLLTVSLPTYDTWEEPFAILGWMKGLVWFSLGVMLRFHPVDIRVGKLKLSIFAWILFVTFLVLKLKFGWVEDLMILPGMFGVWLIIPDTLWNRMLVSCAFPVFLVHGFVVLFLPIVYDAWPELRNTFWGFLFMSIVVFGVSLFLAMGLRRCLPRASALVFGR